jgi:hypothetical protein
MKGDVVCEGGGPGGGEMADCDCAKTYCTDGNTPKYINVTFSDVEVRNECFHCYTGPLEDYSFSGVPDVNLSVYKLENLGGANCCKWRYRSTIDAIWNRYETPGPLHNFNNCLGALTGSDEYTEFEILAYYNGANFTVDVSMYKTGFTDVYLLSRFNYPVASMTDCAVIPSSTNIYTSSAWCAAMRAGSASSERD